MTLSSPISWPCRAEGHEPREGSSANQIAAAFTLLDAARTRCSLRRLAGSSAYKPAARASLEVHMYSVTLARRRPSASSKSDPTLPCGAAPDPALQGDGVELSDELSDRRGALLRDAEPDKDDVGEESGDERRELLLVDCRGVLASGEKFGLDASELA